jgi:hypothetical protein
MATKQELEDLRAVTQPDLEWDPKNAVASLRRLFAHAAERADEAANWYLREKKGKSRAARALRFTIILLTTAAGILPILQQIYAEPDGKPPFAPAWASVVLAVAAFCLLMDKFFGYSNAWMRYITAELQIKQARESFDLDCQATLASFGGGTPTLDQLRSAIAMVKAFVDQINSLIATETAKWVTEFQEALRQIDESVKAGAQAAQTGSLAITVENGDLIAGPGWALIIDQAAATTHTGKTAAIVGLLAGDHVVRVSGAKDGKPLRAEAVASVRAGTTTAILLTPA